MNPAVDFIGVSHTYARGRVHVEALKEVTLSIARGEMVAVMGPSGSGKSTLLSVAGGLERATAGIVRVDGVELRGKDAAALAQLRRKKVGYVFQNYNVLPSLTAVENVALPLELDGVAQRKARRQALQALRDVDLARIWSGGMKRDLDHVASERGIVGVVPRATRGLHMDRTEFVRLEDLPNIGPAIAAKLRRIDIEAPADLIGRDPYALFDELTARTGERHDPCLLDVFISATRFMGGAPAKPWWKYTTERKAKLRALQFGTTEGPRGLGGS
ncbi:MAG: ATP-binding cassette domain-containing protein [Actinobacteria bacterium]|nr:ATP-binding cassette domain-containing protein [Actinomycetota bacterium]